MNFWNLDNTLILFFNRKIKYLTYLKDVTFFLKKTYKFKPLYVVISLKGAQIFFNLLNWKYQTKIMSSVGFVLKALRQLNKSYRRKLKGFFLFFTFIKKTLKKTLKKNTLIFLIRGWKKINPYLHENILGFLKSFQQYASATIVIEPRLPYGKVKMKKSRSIKKRITKKLVFLEKTFLPQKKINKT